MYKSDFYFKNVKWHKNVKSCWKNITSFFKDAFSQNARAEGEFAQWTRRLDLADIEGGQSQLQTALADWLASLHAAEQRANTVLDAMDSARALYARNADEFDQREAIDAQW